MQIANASVLKFFWNCAACSTALQGCSTQEWLSTPPNSLTQTNSIKTALSRTLKYFTALKASISVEDMTIRSNVNTVIFVVHEQRCS